MPGTPVYAALDLGTNNCRLLVAVPRRDIPVPVLDGTGPAVDAGFEVIDSFSRIVRLGEGLQATERLSDQAMDRTVAALHVCASKIRRRGATRIRSVATEACRRASNCDRFVERVERETGITLEIVDGKEEAFLAMRGCLPLFVGDCPWALVFDIGGGSTEIMWLRVGADLQPRLVDCLSVPWGVVRMAEAFGGRDVTTEVYVDMVDMLACRFEEFETRHDIRRRIERKEVQMVGTSGTVTTLAGVHLRLPRYQRDRIDGRGLTFGEASRAIRRLREMDYERRTQEPCVGPERADLVLAGCAVLEAICETWPVGRLRVGDRGVREGILFGLMAEDGVSTVGPTTPIDAVAIPS